MAEQKHIFEAFMLPHKSLYIQNNNTVFFQTKNLSMLSFLYDIAEVWLSIIGSAVVYAITVKSD
jgi:hypothetical protein